MKSKRKLPLILASASPRRAELLLAAGLSFTVKVSPHPEPARKPAGIPVDLWPMCLAYIKAAAVQRHLSPRHRHALILAADTIVVIDGEHGPHILNKPANRSHAHRMLTALASRTHRVITGICLLSPKGRRLSSAQAACRIKNLSPARLEAYLDTNLWKGKAGAYGIQDKHDPFVTLISGDITTVIGLPIGLVKQELACFTE